MNVLVTGGCGFIGGHLVHFLNQQGHRCTVIDDLSTGTLSNLDLEAYPQTNVYISTCQKADLVGIMTRHNITHVVHLAATVGVKRIMDFPVETIENNIEATGKVLQAAAAQRIMPLVILASTSECYGKATTVPFNEDGDIVLGSSKIQRWGYAASKLTDELLGMAYMREKGVPVVICRFFNVVGAGQVGEHGMVLPRFVEAALKNEPIIVHGSGLQSRCFSNVKDVVSALNLLLDCGQPGEVYNVGSDKEISIADLARLVISVTESKSGIELIPYEQVYGNSFEDMQRRVPDLTRLRSLGWQPTVDLPWTISEVANWMKVTDQALEKKADNNHTLVGSNNELIGAAAPFQVPYQVADFLNGNFEKSPTIETWERELGILTGHHYHYPDQSYLAENHHFQYRSAPGNHALGSSYFSEVEPDYLIVGWSARSYQIYDSEFIRKNCSLMARIGVEPWHYEIYKVSNTNKNGNEKE